MKVNKEITAELLQAIQKRTEETFEVTVSGGLKHYVSSEGKKKGLYVTTIKHDNKAFDIYMC
jgi:hypothetical protein